MEKSHKSRFFLRNLSEKSTINQLPSIHRCKKCNHYNTNNDVQNQKNNLNSTYIYTCYFCGNPNKIN